MNEETFNEANVDWDEGFVHGLSDKRAGNPALPPTHDFDFDSGYAAGYAFDSAPDFTEAAKEGMRLQGKDGTVVLTPKKTEDGEFVVRVMVNGKNDEDKAYYTDDWDDAVATAKKMAESITEDAAGTYVWGVFKDAKGGFYANKYYSENEYPSMVQGNMTQAAAEAKAKELGGPKE